MFGSAPPPPYPGSGLLFNFLLLWFGVNFSLDAGLSVPDFVLFLVCILIDGFPVMF